MMKRIGMIIVCVLLLVSVVFNMVLLNEKESKSPEQNPLKQNINQTDGFSELEQAYEEECALTNGITVEMIEVTQRYTESWKAEAEKYELLISGKLEGSNKALFEETQEAWNTYSDENMQMIGAINEQVYEGGSYLNILEADLAYQKYHDRAIELRELYELLEMM